MKPRCLTPIFAVMIAVLVFPALATAQGTQGAQIEAKPVPGQLDVLQGTAILLGGKPPEDGLKPSSYHWEIIHGEGGLLLKPDQAEAIFQAPKLQSTDLEVFIVQLTVEYPGQDPSTATIHVRVHSKMPDKPKDERPIEEIMADQYRREAEAKQRRSSSRNRTVVVHNTSYSPWGYGFGGGWGWGWPAHYPVHVPIVVPPPGIDWGPGDMDWDEPVAIPYDDMVTTFPEEIAADYLPQDYPGAEPIPDQPFAGTSPTDFIEPPDFGGTDDFGGSEPMIDPGFGGTDFAEPMIDPGFGFDDFGW